jgi:hypothetical protein
LSLRQSNDAGKNKQLRTSPELTYRNRPPHGEPSTPFGNFGKG